MILASSSSSWFGASTLVLLILVAAELSQAQLSQDNCKIECYPNSKMMNGKGGQSGVKENCRWILRTDGKAARLCDHIKCRKVCPNNQAASSLVADQQEAAASSADNLHIEQRLVAEDGQAEQAHGAMRHLHGSKLAKAPVPGVAGGRLAQPVQHQQAQQASGQGRRMAPTLPPAVQYDENDSPPPISRFLDISPEE